MLAPTEKVAAFESALAQAGLEHARQPRPLQRIFQF
jgi:hypothetical protein